MEKWQKIYDFFEKIKKEFEKIVYSAEGIEGLSAIETEIDELLEMEKHNYRIKVKITMEQKES